MTIKTGFRHEDEDGSVGNMIRAFVEPVTRFLHDRDMLVHNVKQIYGLHILQILLVRNKDPRSNFLAL